MRTQQTTQSTAGRRPRGTDSDQRERLLDAAICLFAERGIANTTVAQIARAGQVTSAMVHYWFDTREKLLDAVANERLAQVIRQIWDPADTEHDCVIELIKGLVMRMLDVTEKLPWLPSLWLREVVHEGGLLRERVITHIPQDRNAAFRQKVVQAQAAGEINLQIKPELLMISMLGLVMLPQATDNIWRRVNPGIVANRADLERHVIALLIHGLTVAAPASGADSRRSRK